MIYVFPIHERYYCFLCCDWFCCQCIGIINAYIYVTNRQLVDSVTQTTPSNVCMVYKPRPERIENHCTQYIKYQVHTSCVGLYQLVV